MPSGLEAAIVPLVLETAKNTPFPQVTDFQVVETGMVRDVHVDPSGEVKHVAVPDFNATKTPFP